MDTKITFTKGLQYITFAMMGVGAVIIAYSFAVDPTRAWANLLLNNYLFLSLAIGAGFFISIQYISQSGWSSMFKRIPEAMMSYIPVAGIIMLLLFFGMNSLYHWTHTDVIATDALVQHKSPYLNVPFFFIRMVLYFASWIIMAWLIRKASINEDKIGGMAFFEKSELYSKIFIFILAVTFTFSAFDWIMSIEVHWFSTLFALKNLVAAFLHGAATIALVAIILHQKGFYKELNKSHLLDFSRYIFMLAIIWGYFAFTQFMLIWYGNIPEETEYFVHRFDGGFKIIFYVNFFINWFVPFVILLPQKLNKNINVVKWIAIMLIAGQYLDLYDQIIPGILHKPVFGITEIGFFIGFAGLFVYIFARALSSVALIPKNHPYLDESLQHHVH